uniref:Nop domain-containing protein n=1 Tax=Panagrolaimus sp. JU765 TaxID=591449 RepID=A0AC34QRH5_9BILA
MTSETPDFVFFEHAVGYALFKVKEFEDVGQALPEVEQSVNDFQRFSSVVHLHAFEPFKNTEAALENCNFISEGTIHDDLRTFLESNLPKKRKNLTLGLIDTKLGSSINEDIGIKCQVSGVVPELLRGIRLHFAQFSKDLPHHSLSKAQLSLGHSYSRGKVKFDVHRVDNMVIQSIALLDQLDKDINLFAQRIREWYAYHYPELAKIVPEQDNYIRCASVIGNRQDLDDSRIAQLQEILDSEEKVQQVVEGARTSMGMEISELDLENIDRFAKRVASLTDYRNRLHEYIKDRMNSCAPSLTALIGEQVGARLIAHAGSLTNLAKYPASTVQILGAEKALFRALKTRSNTPKYGLLYHSSFIARASLKNKGRISRYVANKCTMASRLDCFSDVPVPTFGEHLKQQVEDRLKYFETGTVPKKNVDVMKEAMEEAEVEKVDAPKKVRKAEKKLIKKALKGANMNGHANGHADDTMELDTPKKKEVEEEAMEVEEAPKKKKKRKSAV